jgi:hypothetical protein
MTEASGNLENHLFIPFGATQEGFVEAQFFGLTSVSGQPLFRFPIFGGGFGNHLGG